MKGNKQALIGMIVFQTNIIYVQIYIDIFILFYYFIRIPVSVFKHMYIYIYEEFNIIIYVFQESIFMDMKIFIKDILIHIFWRTSFKFQNRYFRCYKFYFSTCLENLSTTVGDHN
jgi:hypothetical protein